MVDTEAGRAGPSVLGVPRAGIVLLFGVAAALAVGLFVVRVSSEMPDFDVYRQAGLRAAAGEPLYRVDDGHYQLKYLPAFAVLAVPLGMLPRSAAAALWFTGSIAALAWLLAGSQRLLLDRRQSGAVLVVVTTIVLGKFYARELLLGQVNLFFAGAIVLALVLMARRKEALAGALVALAIVLKPYAVLLLPWLAARRQWPSLWTAAGGLLAALLLPAVRYGAAGTVDLHAQWWDTVISSTAPNLLNPDNVSWLAMYTRWFGSGAAASTLALVTALVVLGAVAWVIGSRAAVRRPDGLECALLLLVMPFLSPQGWDYVLLIATPAVVLLVNDLDRLPGTWRPLTIAALAVIGLTLYDVMGRTLYQAFMHASGITLCAFVLIGAVVMLRRRGIA